MKLEFDYFSYLNAKRCQEDFKRTMGFDSAVVHVLAACGEIGEMAQEMKRIMDSGQKPTEEQITKLLRENADAFTYMDLVASHFGRNFSDILVEKFNIVSDRVGSKIKIVK